MKNKILLPHQAYYIQAPFMFPEKRWFMLVAGYGAGKSMSNAFLLLYAVKMLQGKKDKSGHKPRIILAGVTYAHLKKTTLGYVLEYLENSKTKFIHDKKDNILHIGGVEVIITPLANPGALKGIDCCIAICDEIDDLSASSIAEDITFEAVRAVNERCRQIVVGFRTPFIAMGSTSQGQKGLYRIHTLFKAQGVGFVLIRGRTQDNIFLDKSYVESLYKVYSAVERRVFLEGEFLALAAGKVFGDFDWERNFKRIDLDKTIRAGEKLYWGQDFNASYNRGCVGVLRGNTIFIIKRYEFEDIRKAPQVVRYDFPHADIYMIPDATAKDSVRHFKRELTRYGIHWIYRTKNPAVEDSVFLVNKLFYTGRLIITRMAEETASAVARAERDKHGAVPKGVGRNSPIHDCDGLRLICHYLACNRFELLDIRKITIARHEDMQDGGAEVVEQLGGYVDIRPA